MAKSFTFYEDYYNLVDTLSQKDKQLLLEAIVDYVFKDIEPKLKGHNLAIFNTLSHQLNLSKSNSKRRTKQEPKENQKKTEEEPTTNKTSVLSFKFNNNKNINIYNYIESNLNITINGYNYERIEELLKTYNEEILCYAIDKTIASGHKTLNYFFGIVKNWKQDNLKTLKDIQNQEKRIEEKSLPMSKEDIELLENYNWLDGE